MKKKNIFSKLLFILSVILLAIVVIFGAAVLTIGSAFILAGSILYVVFHNIYEFIKFTKDRKKANKQYKYSKTNEEDISKTFDKEEEKTYMEELEEAVQEKQFLECQPLELQEDNQLISPEIIEKQPPMITFTDEEEKILRLVKKYSKRE